MDLTKLLAKDFGILALVPLILILAGIFLIGGSLVPLYVGYEGPVGRFEVLSTEVVEGLALIIIGAISLYFLYTKHKQALARIERESVKGE